MEIALESRIPAMPHAFSNLTEFATILTALPEIDPKAMAAASDHNGQLTKPPGALGRLEEIAIWYAGWRGEGAPHVKYPQVVVFAGNHGVTQQGVSAFPAEVTEQMVLNFQRGGAAINQLCRVAGAKMDVIALDLDRPTADFTAEAAMPEGELVAALQVGWDAVDPEADLLVVGEMGIGNTTSAAAIANAIFGGDADDWVGRGTGVDDAGLSVKADVVRRALARHSDILAHPLQVLAAVGGRELAAMAGAIVRARVARIPVILDGFICTAAASVLERQMKGALDHCLAGHVSAEQAHHAMLDKLGKVPLLSLGLRLGEASGAALAINIVTAALECHSGMATFADAGVSEG